MRLASELKDKGEVAETMEEKKDIIAQAGMELADDELDSVSGGYDSEPDYRVCIFCKSTFNSFIELAQHQSHCFMMK